MKKKILKILCFLFLFNFGMVIVNAEYTCQYKYKNDLEEYVLKIKYDDSGTPSVEKTDGRDFVLKNLEDNFAKNISVYTIKDARLIGKCPGRLIYGIDFKLYLTETECNKKSSICISTPYISGGSGTFNQACHQINLYQIGFEDSINEYGSCNGDASCQSNKLGKIKDSEDLLKSYCRTIISNYSLNQGDEEECVNSCLEIDTIIKNNKEKVGITKGNSGDCGFSGRLLVWINNIMRWIKYILPVIVILLGIVDFIKAIAADKEDEMKKAQGRFVKRLISAAIVFLVPLIIEFILNVMGFKYDSCSLF